MADRSTPGEPSSSESGQTAARYRRQRKLSAIVGGFLLVIVAGSVTTLGSGILSRPLIAIQLAALGLAGIFDLVSGIERLPNGPLAWYQWSGLGNLCLGLSLPLGFLGGETVLLAVLTLGGLSLAAIGVDMLVFHGAYTKGTPLDESPEQADVR
ncbi:hypothetical protein [Halovenus halobia]|uniref:hypothetical protein n=1 Tax=Halovenus halobia TaxID=3396622 RepID=UPI003F5679D3